MKKTINKGLTYEDIAQRAQQYVSDKPVLVLGTGATIPYGLPSMEKLADTLLKDPSLLGSGFTKFRSRLSKTRDLELTLHDVSLSTKAIDNIVDATWRLVSEADLALHHKLVRGEATLAIESLLRHLLRTADAKVSVVTPNYDRIAEYATNRVNAHVSTGMTAGPLPRFIPGMVNQERMPHVGYEGQVVLLKVHGSLDWFMSPSGEIIALPFTPKIPDGFRPLVVTPGVSKYREVHKDPFRTIIAAADNVLRAAHGFLCVGYGFNDEHIQPILVRRVQRDGIPLLVITKALTEAARESFLKKTCHEFMLIEEHPDGSCVFCPEAPSGMVLKGISVWCVDNFMKMIAGKKVGNP